MAPDRSKAGGNRNRLDKVTDDRANLRVHLEHHGIASQQGVVRIIGASSIGDLADVDTTTEVPVRDQSLIWDGDNWVPGGPEILIPVKNASTTDTLSKGEAVYVSGSAGASGKPEVSLAQANALATMPAIGLIHEDILPEEEGHVVGGGVLVKLNTSAFAVGTALYVDFSTAGALIGTRPTGSSPEEYVQKIALVTRQHATDGQVIVMGAGRTNDIPNALGDVTALGLTSTGLRLLGRASVGEGALEEIQLESTLEFSTGPATLGLTDGGVSTTKVDDGAITAVKLASGGQYHGAYNTQAETRRSGATATTEIYYTARPDGDGYAENEVTTSTPAGFVIERKLYFSDKFDADPDTAADWTLYTTQPADNTAFATAKASLLAGLSDTDGTANTRGTLPVSLKMEHRFSQDLLLEDYPGAAAGYSLRKISTDYTGSAIRIREDGTNTETDIGFDSNGDLNTAAIATHCGSNNGFVVTWYDQSGNSRDATTAADTNEPKIYDGTTGVHTTNGKPALQFDGVNDYMDFPNAVQPSDIGNCSVFTVQAVSNSFAFGVTLGSSSNSKQWYHTYVDSLGDEYWGYNGASKAVNLGTASTKQKLITAIAGSTQGNAQAFVDGVSKGTRTLGSGAPTAGEGTIGWDGTAFQPAGDFQEVIVYHSDQSANRTDIEADISAYWQSNRRTLDAYPGAAAAYSVRKLDNDYTGSALRVREDSGNTEADIGFDSNGNLDTAAIASHCGSANGYVVTWYDQSGNGNDLTQSTASDQPEIYNGTTTKTVNNRSAMSFVNDRVLTASVFSTSTTATVFEVFRAPTTDTFHFHYRTTTGGHALLHNNNGRLTTTFVGVADYNSANSVIGNNQQALVSAVMISATSLNAYKNGSSVISTTPGTMSAPGGTFRMGAWQSDGFGLDGELQEWILYDADESSNRTGIESDIDTYYGVTTQRLLDTYSGAAAAYSVRKLSQWYTGNCMRIREDSGDTETDIGFDSNGDLDTAAIASHCGSANGYVVTWYDQSGSGRDISQSTTTKQPLIYNGTSVNTAGGKPALDPRGNAARLYSAAVTISPTLTAMLVKQGAGGAFAIPVWGSVGSFELVRDNPTSGGAYGISTAVGTGTPPTNAIYTMKYGSDSATRSNGSEVASTTGNTTFNVSRIVLGGRYEKTEGAWSGQAQEFVIWDSDLYSANAADIESNANTYFSIF